MSEELEALEVGAKEAYQERRYSDNPSLLHFPNTAVSRSNY